MNPALLAMGLPSGIPKEAKVNPALIDLAIQEAPAAIALVKDLFAKHNPDAPVPTDEEVAAAWKSAFESSLAKDDAWLAAHPVS